MVFLHALIGQSKHYFIAWLDAEYLAILLSVNMCIGHSFMSLTVATPIVAAVMMVVLLLLLLLLLLLVLAMAARVVLVFVVMLLM